MTHYIGPANPMHGQFKATADYQASHFAWHYGNGVGTITLNRPERKNPLTFDSYHELRTLFYGLRSSTDVKAVVVTGAGGNFCSGGDVHEIIGPLTRMTMPELLAFMPVRLYFSATARAQSCSKAARVGFFSARLRR